MSEQSTLPAGVPPLTQYYVYMTAGCNLACQHCWLAPAYQPKGTTGGHLDYELFKLAMEEGIPLGLQSVKLTGGEPLLHPDFLRFVDLLKEKNLGLTMETNGTLMTPEIARHLKEMSTLAYVSISIDGAKVETHDAFRSVKGSYARAVAGIKMLVEQGYHPQVIMSLHIGNVNEIEELVHLAENWGAGSVKFNLIQPSGRAETMSERGQVLDIKRLIELGNWVEHDLQKSVSIPLFYSWPMAFYSTARFLKDGGSGTCGIFNILGILANGSLAMCGIGMEIPELVYGKLAVNAVADVWSAHPMLQKLREDVPAKQEGICSMCMFKNRCLGSCIANNFHESRSLTASNWFCQTANQAELFPPSRLSTIY